MQLPPPPGKAPAAPLRTEQAPTQVDADGEVLGNGRYVVGARLGSGGMAEVRRGRDLVLDREVAIKLFRGLPDDFSGGGSETVSGGLSEGGLSERERSEAQLLASLDHPGLVKVHDVGYSAQRGWVVMDLVEGPDLHILIHGKPLPVDRIWSVARDVSRALAYVHGKGITHRDVKPSNVLTREADRDSGRFEFVLTDFGIARRNDSARLTLAGQTIGTAAYFSPEQARGGEITPATDVYALGLVLLECLTGHVAYDGQGLETALARLHRSPEIPATANPAWRQLITRMTAMEPADRPTAAEVAEQLVADREHLLAKGQDPTASYEPSPAPTRHQFVLGLPEETAGASAPAHAKEDSRAAQSPSPQVHGPAKKPVGGPRVGPRSRKRLAVLAGAVVVVLVVVLVLVLSGVFTQAPPLEPLPSVPGVPGERLSELYESVQP